ncbi:hypothetical protein ABIB08_006933 [Bradyrhizobium sp. RT11b]
MTGPTINTLRKRYTSDDGDGDRRALEVLPGS